MGMDDQSWEAVFLQQGQDADSILEAPGQHPTMIIGVGTDTKHGERFVLLSKG